ncbi:MAG TPA: hypothetical protein VIS74_07565, partial [Chthoniobacterales bacterium]
MSKVRPGLVVKNHDLSLPDWGPYGKRHAGASHIADRENGLRFDLSVFPALYRRKADVPSAGWESGYHPWASAPRFEYFSFRHEILWKDQVYADISYSRLAGHSGLLVRCELVNATPAATPAALHFMASLAYPSPWQNSREPLRKLVPRLPEGAVLIHPLDYSRLDFAGPEPMDALGPDGSMRGETRGQEFLDGSALGGRFGRDEGDAVTYCIDLDAPVSGAHLVIRCRSTSQRGQSEWNLRVASPDSGEPREIPLQVKGADPENHVIPLGKLNAGRLSLTFASRRADSALELVFLALAPGAAFSGDVPVRVAGPQWTPERLPGAPGRSLILKYPDAPSCYGLAWEAEPFEVRQILHSELDSFLRAKTHDHVNETLLGDGQGHFTNVFLRPITLPPHSRRVIWGLVCEGSPEGVGEILAAFAAGGIDKETIHAEAKKKKFAFAPEAAGRAQAFGQNLMAAVTLTNAVFPIYMQRQQVRHRTPGRLWDSLYTWDSGFIGLGLLEIDPAQAEENLAQYLTEPGNPHAAYVHHGSTVPMQIHLYHELWNRTQSRELLERHYASIRQYYRFFAGHAAGSTLRNLKSGLLRSWDYFYNSGGWDDYPPQKHVHAHRLTDRVTTASVTAHAIRCARSLALLAGLLEKPGDAAEYRRDIETFSAALQTLAWDPAAGYFSYVTHDAQGAAEG